MNLHSLSNLHNLLEQLKIKKFKYLEKLLIKNVLRKSHFSIFHPFKNKKLIILNFQTINLNF